MRKERRSGGSHIEAYLFFNSLTAYIKLQSHIRRSRSEAPAVSRERGLPNTSSFAPPTRAHLLLLVRTNAPSVILCFLQGRA